MVAVKHLTESGAAQERGRANTLALVATNEPEKAPEVGALDVLKDLFRAFLNIKLKVHGLLDDGDALKFETAFTDALKEFTALSPQTLTDPDVVEQMHIVAEDVYNHFGEQDPNKPFDIKRAYSELINQPKGIFWLKSMLQNRILKALKDQGILPTSDDPDKKFADIQKFGIAFEEALMSIIEVAQNAFANPQIIADLNFIGHIMKVEDQVIRDAKTAHEAGLKAQTDLSSHIQPTTDTPSQAA